MKVLHIITGLNDGGAEATLDRLCRADKNNKHYIISMMDLGKYGLHLKESNISVDTLNMPQGKLTFKGLFKLYKLIKKNKPDAVQTWMYHADLVGGIIARFSGVKNISWGIHHSNLTPGDCKKSTILIAKLCSYLSYIIPRNIICCADYAAKVHAGIGYCQSKLKVIYNGYDLDLFYNSNINKNKIKKEFNIPDTTVLLGMVGRFHPFKDHENLIKSLNILKKQGYNFKCLLVGKGMECDNVGLISWLVNNNVKDNVILAGSRDDIPNVMNGLDIHLLSSSSEAFPNVLNEAMACGTPCVTTNVGDAATIVSKLGWVANIKKPDELALKISLAIDEMLDKPMLWRKRKKDARNRIITNYSLKIMLEKYESVWRYEK